MKIYTLLISVFLFLMLMGCASATILDVGSGQTYATNGTHDEVAINNAITAATSGDTVYIHAGTYSISAPINITSKSNVILRGDGLINTIIHTSSYDAFLGSAFSPVDYYRSYIMISSSSGIEIYGINLVGSYPTEIHQLMQPETWSSTQWASKYTDGDDSENAIFISGSCNNDKIHDMKFNLVSNNAIKDFDTTNLQIYNCDFRDSNHDCVEAGDVTGLVVHNNYMELAHDCGVRIVSGINCVVSNNTCVGTSNHENGAIYFQKTATNATVTYNIISNLYSATISGIYTTPWHADSGDFGTGTVSILHNVFYNNVGTVVSDSVNPGYGTNYTNNPNFFLPAMTVTPTPTGQTIPNNLFPIVLANWTAQGYGYQATGER